MLLYVSNIRRNKVNGVEVEVKPHSLEQLDCFNTFVIVYYNKKWFICLFALKVIFIVVVAAITASILELFLFATICFNKVVLSSYDLDAIVGDSDKIIYAFTGQLLNYDIN